MKTVKDILSVIRARSPFSAAMDWDNVGLLVGDEDHRVRRIHVALDATDEAIRHAADARADLLVTHHPMLFAPLKKVVADDFIGRRVIAMISHDMSYIAMHTNYDIFGMAELAAEKMALFETEPLDPIEVPEYPEGASGACGIGRVGRLHAACTLSELAAQVKGVFGLTHVQYFGDSDVHVEHAAICPGSGKSEIEAALRRGADVLITGDIDHHSGMDAVARGLCIIDAGHYGIEYIFIEDMASYFREALGEEVEVTEEPISWPIHFS